MIERILDLVQKDGCRLYQPDEPPTSRVFVGTTKTVVDENSNCWDITVRLVN